MFIVSDPLSVLAPLGATCQILSPVHRAPNGAPLFVCLHAINMVLLRSTHLTRIVALSVDLPSSLFARARNKPATQLSPAKLLHSRTSTNQSH